MINFIKSLFKSKPKPRLKPTHPFDNVCKIESIELNGSFKCDDAVIVVVYSYPDHLLPQTAVLARRPHLVLGDYKEIPLQLTKKIERKLEKLEPNQYLDLGYCRTFIEWLNK